MIAHFGLSIRTLRGTPLNHSKAPVAGQPGLDALVAHQFSVLVPTPRQGHDEEPGLEHFAGMAVGDQRSRTEVDLRLFAHGKVEHHGGHRGGGGLAAQEAIDGMHAAAVAVLASQRLADAAHRDALAVPLQNLLAKGLDRRQVRRVLGPSGTRSFARRLVVPRDRRVVRQRARRLQPVLSRGDVSHTPDGVAPNPLRSGDRAIAFAQSQALNHLSYFVHFELPVSHCACPRQNCQRLRNRKSETASTRLLRGLIAPRLLWPHCAASPVASLRRHRNGLIAPRINSAS